ncbi:MAG TPA: Ku protein, partial [Actinomycetales bacterium]|nr:Ku protein [Actinomycetales bacterium]
AVKPYALLREALNETDRMAVVKVALRQRETLAVLRVRDDVICLQTMLWPDEVREADFDILDADVDLRPQELKMAASLVESLASDFDPSEFTDNYTEAVRELIEAKVSSGEVRQPQVEAEEAKGGEVVDLLTALQRSVEKAKAARGEEPEERAEAATEDEIAEEKAAGRKATVKKAPAKKSTAKKAAAKKEPAKKAAPKKTAKKTAAKKSATKKSA